MKKKKGQIWIETVTYTLVAFVIIGLVLTFARPKIQEIQDKTIIEQSISMLKEIDSIINDLNEKGVGNKRKVQMSIKKGEIKLNSTNESLTFYMEGKHMYSQLDQPYTEGDLNILTQQKGAFYNITIEKKYTTINLTYSGKEETKAFTESPTPYTIFISNKGGNSQNIDFELE